MTDALPALAIGAESTESDVVREVRTWVDEHVPEHWRAAAAQGGAAEIRRVRPRAEYEAWYPVFGRSGLVVPTWPVEYGGLGVSPALARAIEAELAPYNLGRLNPLGLNLAAPALFAHGTEWQRQRFLPPIARAEEIWCQLFSEPGAGSDLASLATRAVRDGDEWLVTGQKVWSTWAHDADFGVLLARTDPHTQKRKGITYFLLPLHQDGVEVRPLRHLTGEVDFNEVFLDEARVPDTFRVGEVDDGWRVANATLSGERQMVSGAGSGGVDRIGGASAARVIELAKTQSAAGHGGGWEDPIVRQRLVRLWSEETIRRWTNLRVRAAAAANRPPGAASSVGPGAASSVGPGAASSIGPGAASSIGKVIQGRLNQELQAAAVDLLGAAGTAWESPPVSGTGPSTYGAALPFEVQGMLRSRANTIEGGTTEVNKNILAERVLGLPREPDPWHDVPWNEVPRNG